MANFQEYPSGEKLSGADLVVDGDSITIGLAGFKDFQGQDLFVTHEGSELSIFPGGVVGNVKLYKLVVNSPARATKTSISDRIYANTHLVHSDLYAISGDDWSVGRLRLGSAV